MKGLPRFALGALLLCAAPAALAQDGNTVGNPQLRDFQLRPGQQQQQQPLVQPVQQAPAPVVVAPPPPTAQPQAPPAGQQPPQRLPQAQRPQPTPSVSGPSRQAPAQPQPQIQPQAPAPGALPPAATPTPSLVEPQAPIAAPPPASAPTAGETGTGTKWLYVLPAAALLLIGLALFVRRRRRAEAEAYDEVLEEAPTPVAAVEPATPRPDPTLRPWLELSLKAERASANLTETVVNFELEISNTGKSEARNLRIDVKMFNAGAEQDKEIGAFFRTAGRESTKLNLPGIGPESTGVISAQVAMPRDEMRAVVLDEKYLFVPVIAVNALYDWGEGRTGQSSKSYVVGRELQQPSDKMGAFRVDQGPRIWRTVGQRQHSLTRRI